MLFKKNNTKNIKLDEEKTVLKIKTVDDIPVIKEMRKYIGNDDIKEAIIYGYTSAKNDYVRFFNANNYGSNRLFIINELKKVNVDIKIDDAYTDNITIKNAIEKHNIKIQENRDNKIMEDNNEENDAIVGNDKNNDRKYYAIKKIALFYFNYYEIARFGYMVYDKLDADEILEKVKDIYNYMDIMKLFYNDNHDGNDDNSD